MFYDDLFFKNMPPNWLGELDKNGKPKKQKYISINKAVKKIH
jgi:hypothetical protein